MSKINPNVISKINFNPHEITLVCHQDFQSICNAKRTTKKRIKNRNILQIFQMKRNKLLS